jgi:hypothetical protein
LSTSAFQPLAVRPLPEPTGVIAVFHHEYPIDRTRIVPKNISAEYTDFFQKERVFIEKKMKK